ncbi:zinc finger protein 362-like [Homarus americanus]|uniref:Zinc finger protein SNAI2-like 3 n=1 Tax=Homarus americanus TaxID=6706 RepID=A0A8J5JLP1_HOMAM|nr:zinc finger protein 362-like [Homarus americanus]KAG7158568.1 Zinc finger protein SNAI2-like 3 [Homarus americanus]
MVVLKNDYSNCPLKKRPLSVSYDDATAGSEQTEPEDLSLKCGRDEPSTPHPHTRPQEQCVHDPHTQELQSQGIRPRESHGQTLCTYGSDRLCPPESCKQPMHTETTRSPSIPSHEPHTPRVSDAHSPCPRQPHRVDTSPESETESTTPARPMCTQTPLIPHHDKHLPVPGNRTGINSHSSMNYMSPSSPLRDITWAGHLPSSPGVGRSMSLEVATPKIHPADLRHSPPFSEATSSNVNAEQAYTNTKELPSAPTNASHFRSSVETVFGVTQDAHPNSVSAVRPHRPWLAEDPPRQTHRQFADINSPLQRTRPNPLLANPPSLWAGMVPLSWPIPHLLAPPHPASPGRHHRECGSPGSESGSSDSSSGAGRGEAPYSCTGCSKSYSTYSGLSKHKQFHCEALGTKSFACKHCDKVYTSLGALKMHIRTHTLPCKCQLCGKAFSRPWLLQGHIRTHTGEKPFQCPQCDRCFADRSNLRAHLQTHADVKKYACVTCHKTFSRMSLLNKHTEAACPALHRRTQS